MVKKFVSVVSFPICGTRSTKRKYLTPFCKISYFSSFFCSTKWKKAVFRWIVRLFVARSKTISFSIQLQWYVNKINSSYRFWYFGVSLQTRELWRCTVHMLENYAKCVWWRYWKEKHSNWSTLIWTIVVWNGQRNDIRSKDKKQPNQTSCIRINAVDDTLNKIFSL